jgi:hypothetical protein
MREVMGECGAAGFGRGGAWDVPGCGGGEGEREEERCAGKCDQRAADVELRYQNRKPLWRLNVTASVPAHDTTTHVYFTYGCLRRRVHGGRICRAITALSLE